MEIYLITHPQADVDAPEAKWTLKDAMDALSQRYSDHRGSGLVFREETEGVWLAYDFHDMDDDQAATIREQIVRIAISGTPPSTPPLLEGMGVQMELSITTREGVSSMSHAESALVWDMMNQDRGRIVERFADRAGRVLADYLTKGDQ